MRSWGWLSVDKPYRDDIERLSGDIQEYEPEVTLAVRIEGGKDDDEENGEIDQFLSSHGFEYVCVRDEDGDDEDDGNDGKGYMPCYMLRVANNLLTGVPNFSRVIDALSTVMWPSMREDGVESDTDREWSLLEDSEEVAATHARIFEDDDVLSRLEEMRAEIAAVEDLEERRRAAALVALGVVYGL